MRNATAERHAILDGGLGIARADASLHDYRAHLSMLRAWLRPAECWLASFNDGPQSPDAPAPVLRTPLLDADLAHPAMPQGRDLMVPTAAWPIDASQAYRWGVCYVIEGSQLGGAVLYRCLAQQLAPHPLTFLRGAEAGPGARWRAFMLALDAAVQTQADIEEACRGACDAFDRILALRV